MRLFLYLCFFLATHAFGEAIAANDRIALIIGNSNYVDLGTLPNTSNDAKSINKSLSEMGFKTKLVLNATEATARKEIKTFATESDGASIALVFYAGHGAQVNGENYLLPIDTEVPKRESDIQLSAIKVDDVINSLKSKTKVIFLDACRDNPALIKSLSKGRGSYRGGLAPAKNTSFDDQGSGIFIAYATDSGNVALDSVGQSNSPFTSALLRHIKDPISIDDMFSMVTKEVRQQTQNSQKPYKYASLDGIVCLPESCRRIEAGATAPVLSSPVPLTQSAIKVSEVPDNWVLYNSQVTPEKILYLIQPSSVKRDGNRVLYSVKMITQKDSSFGFLSSKNSYNIVTYAADCISYKGNTVDINEYDSSGNKIKSYVYGNIKTIDLNADWSSPSSIGYASVQLACNADRFAPLANKASLASSDWERFYTLSGGELFYSKSSLKKGKEPEILTKITFPRVDLSKLKDSLGLLSGYEEFNSSVMVSTLVSKNRYLCNEEKSYQTPENYYDEDGTLMAYSSYQDLPPEFFKNLSKNAPTSPLGQLSKLVCQ